MNDAAGAYARAAEVNPRIDVTTQRAAALINAGEAADAARSWSAAIKKSAAPDAVLLYMLGPGPAVLKDLDAATATAQKLKSTFPGDSRGTYLDVQVLRDGGRPTQAIASLARPDEAHAGGLATSLYDTPACSSAPAARRRRARRCATSWRAIRRTPTR